MKRELERNLSVATQHSHPGICFSTRDGNVESSFAGHLVTSQKQMLIENSSALALNPRDGGAWWAAVYGVAQSGTQLK